MAPPNAHARALLHAFFLEHPDGNREAFEALRARYGEYEAELDRLYSEVAQLGEVLHLTPASIVGGMESSLSVEPIGVDVELRPPRIQGFDVIEELGHGGMGVVWRARDTELGRAVAVKVLHEKLATNEAALKRFVVEARVTGQLQHPGIVSVYRLGVAADGRPFLAMKLVRGRTLAEIRSGRDGSSARSQPLLSVFQRICEAVAYAHSRGVVHRDLKPSNVMVGSFGEVQVLDWGLAKVLGEEDSNPEASVITPTSPDSPTSDESVAGSVVGTPSYMAPEQASGEVEKITQRSDVFSLGGILCELLTGRSLHAQRRQEAFGHLEECGAERELVELARQCLAQDPDERPADAGHVARAVSSYLAAVDQRAREAEAEAAVATARAAQERAARRRTLAAGSAVLVALLVATFAFRQSWRHQALAAEGTAATLANARSLFERGDFKGAAQAAESILDRASELGIHRGSELRTLARNADLMGRLTESNPRVVPGGWLDEFGHRRMRVAFRGAFIEHGTDVIAADTGRAAEHLKLSGVDDLVRPHIDDWTLTEFYLDGWSSSGARKLLALASALDGDPTRREMREILAENPDREQLRAFLAEERADSLDPSTLMLLILSTAELYPERGWGDLSDAHAAAASVRARYPDDARVVMQMGEICFFMGVDEQDRAGGVLTPEARAWFHETVECFGGVCALDPDVSIAWALLGHLYTVVGDSQRADVAFSEAMQRMRKDTSGPNSVVSGLMLQLGYGDRVIRRLSALLEESPDAGGLWRELAWSLCHAPSPRDIPRALEAARRAVESEPDRFEFLAIFARAQYYAGEYGECADTLDRIVGASLCSDELKLMRAICLHELGQEEEAALLGRRMLSKIRTSWDYYPGTVFERGGELFESGSTD